MATAVTKIIHLLFTAVVVMATAVTAADGVTAMVVAVATATATGITTVVAAGVNRQQSTSNRSVKGGWLT